MFRQLITVKKKREKKSGVTRCVRDRSRSVIMQSTHNINVCMTLNGLLQECRRFKKKRYIASYKYDHIPIIPRGYLKCIQGKRFHFQVGIFDQQSSCVIRAAAGVAARLNPDLPAWRDSARFKGNRGRPFYCFCQRMKTVCELAVTLQFEIRTTMVTTAAR